MAARRKSLLGPLIALAVGAALVVVVVASPARPTPPPNPRPRWRASHGLLTADGLRLFQDEREQTGSSFPFGAQPLGPWADSTARWMADNLSAGDLTIFVDGDPRSGEAQSALENAIELLEPLPFSLTFE